MALFAIAVPILPGKMEQWKRVVAELHGPRLREYQESRRRLGVRERVFLQSLPQGDIVIVTVEGENPAEAFMRFDEPDDEFTRWFRQQVKEIHGVDLAGPLPGSLPELYHDSEAPVGGEDKPPSLRL